RLRRGASERGGVWGAISGPPTSVGETSGVNPEARHGCAGARPSVGGCGGPYRGLPRQSARHPVSTPRRATAAPGRVRAWGGVGGHIGASHVSRRDIRCQPRGAPRLRRGASERGGVWGAISGPPTSVGETSGVNPEARHGCAGARPSAGGSGG